MIPVAGSEYEQHIGAERASSGLERVGAAETVGTPKTKQLTAVRVLKNVLSAKPLRSMSFAECVFEAGVTDPEASLLGSRIAAKWSPTGLSPLSRSSFRRVLAKTSPGKDLFLLPIETFSLEIGEPQSEMNEYPLARSIYV